MVASKSAVVFLTDLSPLSFVPAESLAGDKQVPKQDRQSHSDSKGEKCVCLHVLVRNLCVCACMHMCVCVFSIPTLMTLCDQASCPNSDCSLGWIWCYICRYREESICDNGIVHTLRLLFSHLLQCLLPVSTTQRAALVSCILQMVRTSLLDDVCYCH